MFPEDAEGLQTVLQQYGCSLGLPVLDQKLSSCTRVLSFHEHVLTVQIATSNSGVRFTLASFFVTWSRKTKSL